MDRAKIKAHAGSGVGLIRDLSLFDITMVGVGAMIGAGIFVLTGIAAGTAGPALILAFALNGVVTIFTAMVYAELGSAIPEAGGGYLWVKEGLPTWNAFLAGWMSWFAHAVAGSLYALGFGSYFDFVLRNFHVTLFGLSGEPLQKLSAVGVAVLFILINFRGVSETGMVGNVVTMGKILILAVFVGSGFLAITYHPEYMDKFTPFAPEGIKGVLVAMGLTFIAFEGYEIIVQAGEEVKNPKRNIPKAIFISLAIVIPVYILVAFTALGAVNPDSSEPTWKWLGVHAELGLAEAARQFMPLGTTLLLVGGLLSTMSALNATTFSSTRVSFAMGRDRNLPDFFSKIHERTRTPYLALFLSGAFIIFIALAMPIEDVAAATSLMFMLLFLQVNVAVVTIRKKYGDKLDYGYLIPFCPVLPFINIGLILILAVFMLNFSVAAMLFTVGWIAVGLAIYRLYASKREREKELTPVIIEERWTASEESFRVLIPIANPNTAAGLIRIGSLIARPMKGELLLLHVARVAPQTPLTGAWPQMSKIRPLIDSSTKIASEMGVDAQSMVRLGHQPHKGIIQTVEEREIDFLVIGWRGGRRDRYTMLGSNIDEVVKYSPCNVVVAQHNVSVPARRVLIPVANPRKANLLLSLGRLFVGKDKEARITVLHLLPRGLSEDDKIGRLDVIRASLVEPGFFDSEDAEISIDRGPIKFEFDETDDILSAIISRTHESDLMIVGSSDESLLKRRIFGEGPYIIARRSSCPVILVDQETNRVKFGIQTFFQFFHELEKGEKSQKDKIR
jgi:APA family basic amino acid/polyamine antiporter